MEIQMIIPESANMACIDHFPTEGNALPAKDEHTLVAHGTTSSTDVDTWHHCLGHLNVNTILQMVCKGMVNGMEISGISTYTSPCEPCLKGKQT
jgi:gag-pre-integrase-like protein